MSRIQLSLGLYKEIYAFALVLSLKTTIKITKTMAEIAAGTIHTAVQSCELTSPTLVVYLSKTLPERIEPMPIPIP